MSVKPLHIIFFGPPGSGKGTQSAKLVQDFQLTHISTGDALRKEIRAGTELGERVKHIMEAGKLVDDDTIMEIVKSAIEKAGPNGFILDGIPRTIGQAQALDKILVEIGLPITHVPFLNVTRDVLKERICGRLFHPGSGRVYHRLYKPPKVEMTDDVTGEPLVVRKDDTEEVFDQRMKEYDATFEPVLKYYSEKNLLHTITGDEMSIEEIYDSLKNHLQQ